MSSTVDRALAALPRVAETAKAAGSIEQWEKVMPHGSPVRGWALFPNEVVARIEISVNGKWVGRARPGSARSDLVSIAPKPEAGLSGFEFWLEAQHIPPDAEGITLGACVMGTRGSVAWLTSEVGVERNRGKPVSINRTPAADELDDDLAVLRERVQTKVEAIPAPPTYPLRLLVVTHDLGLGGAQLFLLEMIRLISAELGAESTVVGLADGPLRDVLEGEGVPVHLIDRDRSRDPIVYEGKMLELAALAARQQSNAVLANTVDAFLGVDLAERIGIPAVWLVHESYDLATWWRLTGGDTTSYLWDRMLRALRTASVAIFEAEATRRQYVRYGNGQRFVAAHYGIMLDEIDRYRETLDRSSLRSTLQIAEDATVVLCLGTLEPRKGQTALALAFSELADEFPDAVLVLVGETQQVWLQELNRELRRFVCRAGLESQLLVVPLTADPYPWLGAADIFVMPSDVESLPRVVLEAMAFELPVLATSIFGVPEVIQEEHTGYMCQARDIGALRDALKRLLGADPGERAAVGRAGAEQVRRYHDGRRYASWLGNVLQQLVAQPDALPDLAVGAQ